MIFTFGKYNGQNIAQVILKDPDYFKWCMNNVEKFDFSERDFMIYHDIKKQIFKRILWYDKFKRKYAALDCVAARVKDGFYDKYSDDVVFKRDVKSVRDFYKKHWGDM